MPHYFLDTSALAKLYRKEIGSDLVDRVVAEPGSRRFISRFTILEMESVLALKFRTGEIDERSMVIARRPLEADLGSRRLLGGDRQRRSSPRSPAITHRPWPDRGASRPGCIAIIRRIGTQTRRLGIGLRRGRPEAVPRGPLLWLFSAPCIRREPAPGAARSMGAEIR